LPFQIISTHRGHGHCIAKGADLDRMMAELYGRRDGYCKGKGGSMHIADPATGNLGANAIVGGSAGIATGAAYASKYLKQDRVAVCFFGEGALGQGLLYEELNLAQLWKRPVIFACENNGYNEYTHFSESTAGDVSARAAAFGMANETVDGQNVRDVYTVASKYIERARRGEGPAFLQFKTYRYHGHHVGDIARAYYRPKAEEQEWVTQRDPITLHGQWLMDNRVADRAALDAVQQALIVEMDAAVEFAVNSPYPDPSKVDQDIYA
jgi:pyruvate dehydrogenase E1 component alpha subunit